MEHLVVAAMMLEGTGLAEAPDKLASWIMGAAAAAIMAFVLIWGARAIKNSNLQSLIPIALVALVFLYLAYAGKDTWKALADDFVHNVLGVQEQQQSQ